MSQHDMNIANQGFPAFRADLNDALGALVSNSSGTTAPATTFAHQFWVDTSANPSILKIRNADNDAWITIGSINQTDDKFKLTPADGVSTDTISELTSAAGVTVDGVLLKDNGASLGGNLAFTGTGNRITGDFSNATVANRVSFQTSTTNGNTIISAEPNGTGAISSFRVCNASDPTNASLTLMTTNATESIFAAGRNGTGTFLPMSIQTGGSEVARFTETGGYLRMASGTGGIQFNGDTAAANALDDYEQGTWTPTYLGGTTNPTITYQAQNGLYVKIGEVVHFSLELETSAVSGGSGSLRVGGLPFTTANLRFPGGGFTTYTLAFTTNSPKGGFAVQNSTLITLTYHSSATAQTDNTISNLTNGVSSNFLLLVGSYRSA